MSASPAGPPSGPPSTTPNGGVGLLQRKKKSKNNAMVVKKPVRKPGTRPPGQPGALNPSNGVKPGPSATKPAPPPVVDAPDPDDDPSLYAEYPLVTTKKALLEGLRYHIMRFVSDKPVDPYDPSEDQFQRPVRLQRRFPHDTPKEAPVVGEGGGDDKEREKEIIRKAERQAEREANQAQIAPTDKTAAAKKRQPFKKKTEDVYFPTDTPEAQKRAKLRYEEGRPWHLEDYTGTNSWVGTYEEPLSETTAMFTLEGNGTFRMVPLEKWYRFAPTGRYNTLNLEEAETHMNKKVKVSRFMGDTQKAEEKKRAEWERQQRLHKGRVGEHGENRRVKAEDDDDDRREDVANDVDEIDFDLGEDFQDDDEDKLFGGDEEDAKEAERKIKEEYHGANIFEGIKDEKDWDEEEEKEKRKTADERKKARKLRKKLIKREKKFEYESDSDHPYSESSESEDSDEERAREEEERKKEEEDDAKANGDKPPSGASTKGTNTPSTRPDQHDSLRNKSSIANLKRPGSPNLSETSGSESNHKRMKKGNGPHSRAMSPGSLSPNGPRRNAGSGSDTEGSGTERRHRPKNASSGLPNRSMPGSPANANTPTGSRAGTPGPPAQLPTIDEVRAAIPPEGIPINNLIGMFKPQISKVPGGQKAFVGIVKTVGRLVPGTNVVTVRDSKGDAAK